MATSTVSNAQSYEPQTTGVLVVLTAKPGVTRDQVMKIMPAEIRATVRLYLEGTIKQWYSRGDGKGVVFILDCKDEAQAHAVMDGLPAIQGKFDGSRVHYHRPPDAPRHFAGWRAAMKQVSTSNSCFQTGKAY